MSAALSLPSSDLVDRDAGIALRGWRNTAGDAVALAAAWADPDVRRWTRVPDQVDATAAAGWIAGDAERRQLGQTLDLVVVAIDDPDQVLGEVGLRVVQADRRWAEVGYWLMAQARGTGRAVAALDLFSAWVLETQPIDAVFAQVEPENPSASHVATRAGYRIAGTANDGRQVWIRDDPTRSGGANRPDPTGPGGQNRVGGGSPGTVPL
ncbi:MAG: family N-acetyltransferase [Acidimicrobiales bacterium]|nr:family N-acetyltransferase [Acidimicrobiales bacterium]